MNRRLLRLLAPLVATAIGLCVAALATEALLRVTDPIGLNYDVEFTRYRNEALRFDWEGKDPASIDLASKKLSDLYVGVSNHYPAQTMSQYNTVRDETQVFFFKAMGGADEAAWTAAMQASIDDIESRASRFASFTAPGDQHCILPYDNFYTVEADGVRLVDWIASMIAEPDVPMSVACQGAECDQPTP